MAALGFVDWLIVNLDTAGWILVILTVGLMTLELTRESAKHGGSWRQVKHRRMPDEPIR